MTATTDRIYISGYNAEGKFTLLSGAMQHLAGAYRINGTFFFFFLRAEGSASRDFCPWKLPCVVLWEFIRSVWNLLKNSLTKMTVVSTAFTVILSPEEQSSETQVLKGPDWKYISDKQAMKKAPGATEIWTWAESGSPTNLHPWTHSVSPSSPPDTQAQEWWRK